MVYIVDSRHGFKVVNPTLNPIFLKINISEFSLQVIQFGMIPRHNSYGYVWYSKYNKIYVEDLPFPCDAVIM